MQKQTFLKRYPRSIAALLLQPIFLLFCQNSLIAESFDSQELDTPRFILRLEKSDLCLADGGINPKILAKRSIGILDVAAADLQQLLGVKPTRKVALHFLSSQRFLSKINAPSWATGVFYRGEILVPVNDRELDDEALTRTLRHEYVHAVLAERSSSQCPAWINEGLAQIFEGGNGQPSKLSDSLLEWVRQEQAMPLRELQRGFTAFDQNTAKIAYAASFYAVQTLLQDYGAKPLTNFIDLVRIGQPSSQAFNQSFQISLEQFQQKLISQIIHSPA